MKVTKSSFPGWNSFPVYRCHSTDDWFEVRSWMAENDCDWMLLSSGSHGYTFQIRKNHEWFLLRWT